MSENPKCIDCEQVMILKRTTKRGGMLITTFECLTCGFSQKRRSAFDPAEIAPRRAGDVNAGKAAAAWKQYEASYRARNRSGTPLTGWILKWDGRRRAYTLQSPTGEIGYLARDLDDLVEALYETMETGNREPLALYAVSGTKSTAGAVSLSTHKGAKSTAAREAARVIDAAFAAAETVIDDNARTHVTDNDGDGLDALIQTPLTAIAAVEAPMCSGEYVTDKSAMGVRMAVREETRAAAPDRAIIRDAATHTDKAADDDGTPESGEIGGFRNWDSVGLMSNPDLKGSVVGLSAGKIIVMWYGTHGLAPFDMDDKANWYDADELFHQPPESPAPAAPPEQPFALGEQVYLRHSAGVIGTVTGYHGGKVKVERVYERTGKKQVSFNTIMDVQRAAPPEPPAPAAPNALQPTGRAREDRARADTVYNRTMDKKKTNWCICAECGKDFRAGRGDAKTCSVKCRKAYSRRGAIVSEQTRELERAITRLSALAKQYPDQRARIQAQLRDAEYQARKAAFAIDKLRQTFDDEAR
jgi:DNA-directed RNA polymerase subunit M/transcription elongation factor TFIIS